MLFITPARNAKEAKDYFTRHMAVSDYYLRDSAEFAGQWHGLGAQLLGLSGTVDKESYFKLCDNINPKTGEPLTPITRDERRVLYDFTFDAPKSVTLAYELGRDERIMDEFRAAIKDTMSEMEAAMMTRVRSNGRSEDRASSNMIWAEFIHRTTRPLDDGTCDPQLHCHGAVFNCSWDSRRPAGKPRSSATSFATKATIRPHSTVGSLNVWHISDTALSATETASAWRALTGRPSINSRADPKTSNRKPKGSASRTPRSRESSEPRPATEKTNRKVRWPNCARNGRQGSPMKKPTL